MKSMKKEIKRVLEKLAEGINGVRPQDANFTEAAIKMAEFCIENGLM